MSLRRLVVLLPLLLPPCAGAAQLLQDEALQRLWDERRTSELVQAARQKSGPQANLALALGLAQPNDPAGLDEASEKAQACIAAQPDLAACHFALSLTHGLRIQQGGVTAALRYFRPAREAWERALQLDPQLAEVRVALFLAYQSLPGIVGGSRDKARALEVAARETQPELAQLLRAEGAIDEKRLDEAERELVALPLASLPRNLQNLALAAWSNLNRQWMKAGRQAHAKTRLEALAKELPQLAAPEMLLGRLAADTGHHEEALRHYERARGLIGAAGQSIDYRVAISAQELGQKDRARSLYKLVLGQKASTPKMIEDVHKRLKQLGA